MREGSRHRRISEYLHKDDHKWKSNILTNSLCMNHIEYKSYKCTHILYVVGIVYSQILPIIPAEITTRMNADRSHLDYVI